MVSPTAHIRFTGDHEWVRLEDGVATVGITDYAQAAIGDIVFVELPEIGRLVATAEAIAVVESVKAANDVYAPLSGRVCDINQSVADDPSIINREPTGEGWFFRIADVSETEFTVLMDEDAYNALVKSL